MAAAIAAHMETEADELNALDGQLGDGDLGVTMTRGGRALLDIVPTLPADVGMALMACAQAMTKVSGSSYGTLLATGLLTAAKATRGRTEVPWLKTGALLRAALDAMKTRGKSALGDKTMLDAFDAAASATEGETEPAQILKASAAAVDATLERMRGMEVEDRTRAHFWRTIRWARTTVTRRVQRHAARLGRIAAVGVPHCWSAARRHCGLRPPIRAGCPDWLLSRGRRAPPPGPLRGNAR